MSNDSFVWSRRRLRAAVWILRLVHPTSAEISVLRRSWRVLPVAGEVDIEEFEDAVRGLHNCNFLCTTNGLVSLSGAAKTIARSLKDLSEELLFDLIIEAKPPVWLQTATNDGEADFIAPELIPDDVAQGLQTIMPDPLLREAYLLARARRVAASVLMELGDAAENTAVGELSGQLCKLGYELLAAQVNRVSLISDELGYDITAPRIDGSSRRIEVKGVRASSRTVSVVVSANEMLVGRADPDWYLLVVQVSEQGGGGVVGWIDGRQLQPLLPVNQHSRGRWSSARLRIPVGDLVEGLPPAAEPGG